MEFWNLLNSVVSKTSSYISYFTNIIIIVGAVWGKANWNFEKKLKEINNDLTKQNSLKSPLNKYVQEKSESGIKDICIRFIYYKNYPYNLEDDGYKYCLHILYHESDVLFGSWKDNVGIKICDHVWFSSCSIYVNLTNGISFVDCRGRAPKGFQEYKNSCLVYCLLYRNILNYDFEYPLEHEPRFYVRYKNDRDNFDNEVQIVSKDHSVLTIIDKRLQMKKYNILSYVYYFIKSKILKMPLLRMKIHV